VDYSTFTFDLACDAEGLIFDVGSLYARLLTLTDRRKCRGLRYPLALILAAVILGKLAGQTKPKGIAEWAQLRKDLFVQAFGLRRDTMPHHNTYRRVLQTVVQRAELAGVVEDFLKSLPEVGVAVHLTLDGKTVRGTIAAGETKGLHLLAVYLPGTGITLHQVEVAGTTNEIPVAAEALKHLDLQGKIVTGDALHTQCETSRQIVEAGGDYLWLVKDNQSQLKQAVEWVFEPAVCAPGFSPAPTDFRTARTFDKGNGRIETRTLTTNSLLHGEWDWPYLNQVFRLERRATSLTGRLLRAETVYGLTSLPAAEAGPERLLALQRAHWAIESELHYRRDVTLGEDACRVKHWGLAHVLAILNNLVVALLSRGGNSNAPQAQRRFDAHPDWALNLLFRAPDRL
jgi:predicted transposase YbfD/YdcC